MVQPLTRKYLNRLGLKYVMKALWLVQHCSNGHTPGITLPSAEYQEAVIRKAYSLTGIDFSDTDYVECHGTGTAVGDVVEVEALAHCFPSLGQTQPLMIGSVSITSIPEW